ncbi:MAG: hypothetical protein L7T81_07100, partial [Candidatus Poseidoniaceae archaeon]|nr:hypothetical protein [Candidatus Poseidoniaceae archaeon]
AYGMQIIDTNGRIAITSGMDIVHLETGKLFGQIAAPISFDSADLEVEDNQTTAELFTLLWLMNLVQA